MPRKSATNDSLSRRERQIMDVVYRAGRVTVADIARELPNAPTDGAIRTMLKILEGKQQIRSTVEDGRSVYTPAVSKAAASSDMLDHVVRTFFDGSAGRAMVRLLDSTRANDLTDDDVERLTNLIEQRRRAKGK